MEILSLGHAGVLIRDGKTLLAIDPFLSGSFVWRGQVNTYLGNSPWISPHKEDSPFFERFGYDLDVIAITHSHGDHFDQEFILKILKINPKVRIIAPKEVINEIKRSIVPNKNIRSYRNRLIKAKTYASYQSSSSPENKMTIVPLPNSNEPHRRYNKRLGYLVEINSASNKVGIFHVGDTHGIGRWDGYLDRITHLITWGVKSWLEKIPEFIKSVDLQRIFWIHWEEFSPGNFHCSQNISQVIESSNEWGLKQELLDFERWTQLS